jgi:hypothetical protein
MKKTRVKKSRDTVPLSAALKHGDILGDILFRAALYQCDILFSAALEHGDILFSAALLHGYILFSAAPWHVDLYRFRIFSSEEKSDDIHFGTH